MHKHVKNSRAHLFPQYIGAENQNNLSHMPSLTWLYYSAIFINMTLLFQETLVRRT
jgi:hypothetical protein